MRTKWIWVKNNWQRLPHPFRWILAATIGFSLVFTGAVFLVLPGPGIPIIIAGLAVLATEFTWAEVLLNRTKHHVSKAVAKVRKKKPEAEK
jgi:uncharacterized protein (TIGR02611 family)